MGIKELINRISWGRPDYEAHLPGEVDLYEVEKDRSSQVLVAPSDGIIIKGKTRSSIKTAYEFLALRVWSRILNAHSSAGDLTFRAPSPMGVYDFTENNGSLVMSFLGGHRIKGLGNLRRSTPVKVKGQNLPIPLYPACALHLGALNEIKELEGLYHSDYDGRHVIFSPVANVSIGVIDVENSRVELDKSLLEKESDKIWQEFKRHTSSHRDLTALDSWYLQGREMVSGHDGVLEEVLSEVRKEYSVNLDMTNMRVDGERVS